MAAIVYLDICCFKRPFDDATAERVRLVRSPAHDVENERNPREDRRLATLLWPETATIHVRESKEGVERAGMLVGAGFAPLDALHPAFAEQAAAKWFVTTDDRLLKRARIHRNQLRVEVLKPDQLTLPTEGEEE